MRSLDEEFPREQGAREIVASLSMEHWRDLAVNRWKQLRHYLWADNPWHTHLSELLRPVSMTTTLGVAWVGTADNVEALETANGELQELLDE